MIMKKEGLRNSLAQKMVILCAALFIGSACFPMQAQAADMRSQVAACYSIINEKRAAAGLPALAVDSNLETAATVRAEETTSLFSHTRPNGSDWWTVENDIGQSNLCYGENLAYGQTSASEVMNDWCTSPGHYANIVSGQYTKVGIGIAQKSNGQWYWVTEFY